MNVATILEATAREHPQRPAVQGGGVTLTYGELNARVNQLANGLRAKGLGEGDVIALTCVSNPAFAIAYYAMLKIGAIALPLNLLLKKDEIAAQLNDAQAEAYLCFEGTPEMPLGEHGLAASQMTPSCKHFWAIPASPQGLTLLKDQAPWNELFAGASDRFDAVDTPGDAPCSITFTSGTTGAAKGAVHTHANEYIAALQVRDLMDIRAEDVVLAALPLFSAWRCAILHTTFLCGAKAVLLPRFVPADVWKTLDAENVTVFHGVGAMFHALRLAAEQTDADLDKIARTWRLSAFGGAPMPIATRKFFEERFGISVRQGYGLTEVIFAVLDDAPARDDSSFIGKPIPGVQLRIVDEQMNDVAPGEAGEILLRSPTLMKGYCNRPEDTRAAMHGAWFRTGDAGRRDAEGNLYLVDRIKDMINRGGFKVYPAQLEAALMAHPAVAMLAVIGVSDERLGEEVKAVVMLKPGVQCGADEFIAWARERVAAYAYPRIVEFVDALPIGPTGKVMKKVLRERAAS